MSLSIRSSLSGGVGRIANRNGLLLLFGYIVLGIVWQVTFYAAFVGWLDQTGDLPADIALPSVEAPVGVLAAGAVISLLLLQYLTIVAIRTLVSGSARSIPSAYYTRNIVRVLVHSILGSIAYGLLVLVGSVLLLVPGIIAYVAFVFMLFYVAADDENFVTALRDSWTLTRGHWLRLFGLLLVVFVGIGLVASVLSVFVMLSIGAIAGQTLGTLISGLLYLPVSLLTLSILADAFVQLRDSQTASTGP